jgi:PAS domain S-box-containing protein
MPQNESQQRHEDMALEYAEGIINTVREPLLALDHDLRVVTANSSFYEVFKVKPEETLGQLVYDLGDRQWDIPRLREMLETILAQQTTFDDYEVEHDFAAIGRRIMLLNARLIRRPSGVEQIILLAIEDITDRRWAERVLQRHGIELESEIAKKASALQNALQRIEQTTLDTIHRLAKAAEFKDQDTGAHIVRVSHYAAAIARRMGQPQSFADMCLYAVPMHDIGKIGIPDHILQKPGKLNEEEVQKMREHPMIGAAILSGSDSQVLRIAEDVSLTHHERWDGSGYPRGLHNEAIPLVGRITAVVDVFDALCFHRPYREAVPVEQAMKMVQDDRGHAFDPAVVDAFMASKEAIMAIGDRFVDVCQPGFKRGIYKWVAPQTANGANNTDN